MKRFPSGQAVFLPLGRTLWTLRRQTMQAIREGARPESYTIIGEETYFPDVLDSILCDLETRMEELEQYFELAFGKSNGAYRCIILWNGNDREGLLVHREKKKLLCAYYPAVTEDDILKEQALVRQLQGLSYLSGSTEINLNYGIKRGRCRLGDLLKLLSEQLEEKTE